MKYLLNFVLFCLITSSLYSQQYPRLNLWSYDEKFSEDEKIIIVKANISPELKNEYNEICNEFMEESYFIKEGSELIEIDRDQHLFYIGLSDGFQQINEYLPQAMKISKEGFSLGPYEFTDSLDVIWLYSNDSKQLFYIGNSLTALRSIYPMQVGMEQYIIVQNHTPTHFGFLKRNGQFEESDHIDIKESRDKYLNQLESEFFQFNYSPKQWTKSEAENILKEEDQKIKNVLKVLELKRPCQKIKAYIYDDKYEKYLLSATLGYGNVFDNAWEIHTLGTGSIEHESIHLIYDHQCPNEFSFITEGIVGYYYCTIDSNRFNENEEFVREHHHNVDLGQYILDDDQFWKMPKYGYPFSANFTKYLIDEYGLDEFKIFGNSLDLSESCLNIYGKTLKQIIKEWEAYILQDSQI